MSCRLLPCTENIFLAGLFGAALIAHFCLATDNWRSAFMSGNEFREAQTAIVSYYIDQQNNFSPLYETPILGKPWISILLEVPFYEWSVVLLSRATAIPHFMAARTISLGCFYLALPALYLLLGRLGLPKARRLLALTLILTCPVYIFYSRAFLMESMEIMVCAWFLLGFVRSMDERRWSWLALTIVAGTLAALIKSITFAVWLVPAAGYGAWMLKRDWRSRRGWLVPVKTILWGTACVAVALGSLQFWIRYTDPIKAAHRSAWIFTSRNLSEGNWGVLEIAARFSGKTWTTLLARWQEAIMPPWLAILGLLAGLFLPRLVRGPMLGLAALFFLAQLMFPFAYAYQGYYFYACTIFLLAAFAFSLHGVLDSALPRWSCGLIIAIPLVAQGYTYWHGYRPAQILKSNGGFPYTTALRCFTPKNSVIIVAGADWAAMIPLYAQRKALMIRNGLEYDRTYLQQAFDDLAGEKVAALVLTAQSRGSRALIELAAERFGMRAVPTFSCGDADVYCHPLYRDYVQECLGSNREFSLPPEAAVKNQPRRPFAVPTEIACATFGNVSPAPFEAYYQYGFGYQEVAGALVLTAHANSDLWLHAPPYARQIIWEFGMTSNAYERDGEKTDGAEFVITGESPSGEKRRIFSRILDPANQPADRGGQHQIIPYQSLPGETLQFSTRPNITPNFDWAYWAMIEVQ